MAERCPEPKDGCRYAGTPQCHISVHHEYWPRKRYASVIEAVFRELPEHTIPLPRCDHDELHATQDPPEKPDLATMMNVIESRAKKPAKNIRRLIGHLREAHNIQPETQPEPIDAPREIGSTVLDGQFRPGQSVVFWEHVK